MTVYVASLLHRDEPLSPELTLVDPVLRAAAIAAMAPRTVSHQPTEEHTAALTRAPALPRAAPRRRRFGYVEFAVGVAVGLALLTIWQAQAERLREPGRLTTTAGVRAASRATGYAIAGGGYIAGDTVRFRVGNRAGALTNVTLTLCGRTVVVPHIPIGENNAFAFRGKGLAVGEPQSVSVSGAFTSSTKARVVVGGTGGWCVTNRRSVIARLS